MDAAEGVFDAVAIVSEPFTIAYGMNRLSDALVIDIGAAPSTSAPITGVPVGRGAGDGAAGRGRGGRGVREERLLKKYPGGAGVANMIAR
jgi:rod shape-determining protein MreB